MLSELSDFGLDVTLGCARDLYGRTFRLREVDARQDREEVCPRCQKAVQLHFHYGAGGWVERVTTDPGHFVLRRALAFRLVS